MTGIIKKSIQSTLGPFRVMPGCKTTYPRVIIQTLGNLYGEYNRAFASLVEANREWSEDYQFCMEPDGTPCNFAVQIDMLGLDDQFLRATIAMSEDKVREEVRNRIFEIENSLALYQLLEKLFPTESEESFFKKGWRSALNELRKRHKKPIALLAVTEPKYRAIKESEFGKQDEEELLDKEVFELSGFDKLFGPKDFLRHLALNQNACQYLLFVRSSDPIQKLRNPKEVVEHPLLSSREVRRAIKANALTFNIDNPEWVVGSQRRINDTKWYMPPLGMAYPLASYEDLGLTQFASYLESIGISPTDVASGRQALRFKPAQGTYGCYGHLRGVLTNKKLRHELRRELSQRGPYMVQPEIEMQTVEIDGQKYTYIDRIFLAMINNTPSCIGGFRSLLPIDSPEAKSGRNHGTKDTVWAEIKL